MRARFNYIGAAAHRPIYNSSKLLLLLMRTWLRVQLPLICNVTVISTFPYVPVADTVCRDGVRVLTKCKRVLSVRGFHLPPPPPTPQVNKKLNEWNRTHVSPNPATAAAVTSLAGFYISSFCRWLFIFYLLLWRGRAIRFFSSESSSNIVMCYVNN